MYTPRLPNELMDEFKRPRGKENHDSKVGHVVHGKFRLRAVDYLLETKDESRGIRSKGESTALRELRVLWTAGIDRYEGGSERKHGTKSLKNRDGAPKKEVRLSQALGKKWAPGERVGG